MPTNVFVSYDHDDQDQVNGFKAIKYNPNHPLDFHDHSLKEAVLDTTGKPIRYPPSDPRSQSVRDEIKSKFDRASRLVVLIGNRTHASEWVNWEVRAFYDMKRQISGDNTWKRIRGMKLKGSDGAIVPSALMDGRSTAPLNWDLRPSINGSIKIQTGRRNAMKLKKWLENWDLTNLKINTGILEAEWQPQEKDREAAWELYIELLTRIVTQPLPSQDGDEKAALDSVFTLFAVTREILRRKGRECAQFTKVAVVVLNQVVRPFTAKWHRLSLAGAFSEGKARQEFRNDLARLQVVLQNYTKALADIAQVEDLTALAFEGTPSEPGTGP